MATNFQVGQKVVCVDDRWPSVRGTIAPLKQGMVYTIGAINTAAGMNPDGKWTKGTCLVLSEVANPEDKDIDYGFYYQRFRPLIERKTDISVFTDMLIKPKQPIPA